MHPSKPNVVVGFQGAFNQIRAGSAISAGLVGSPSIDFTLLPVPAPGGWIKIGGEADHERFANDDLNTFARVAGPVTAGFIPLIYVPREWRGDEGIGRSIKIFVSTYLPAAVG